MAIGDCFAHHKEDTGKRFALAFTALICSLRQRVWKGDLGEVLEREATSSSVSTEDGLRRAVGKACGTNPFVGINTVPSFRGPPTAGRVVQWLGAGPITY